MAKITGIGKIFFKNRNKGGELAAWYQKNLVDEPDAPDSIQVEYQIF